MIDINNAIACVDEIDDCLRMSGGPYPFGALRTLVNTLVDVGNAQGIKFSEESKATLDFIETYVKQEQEKYDEYMRNSEPFSS